MILFVLKVNVFKLVISMINIYFCYNWKFSFLYDWILMYDCELLKNMAMFKSPVNVSFSRSVKKKMST